MIFFSILSAGGHEENNAVVSEIKDEITILYCTQYIYPPHHYQINSKKENAITLL